MWFLWSGTEPENCDGADVCTAIKTLGMQLENLYSLVENISMSLQPPPGKLEVTGLIASSVSVYRFSNECFIWVVFSVTGSSCKELYDNG